MRKNKIRQLYVKYLLLFLVFLLPQVAVAREENSCPCTKLYSIQKARIAFLGRLENIETIVEECPGFLCRRMDMTFKIEEPWRGVPASGKIKLRTDDTSCGYGFQLAPPGEEPKIGQTFAIFAEEEGLSICNSVIMHSSLLTRTNALSVYFNADK